MSLAMNLTCSTGLLRHVTLEWPCCLQLLHRFTCPFLDILFICSGNGPKPGGTSSFDLFLFFFGLPGIGWSGGGSIGFRPTSGHLSGLVIGSIIPEYAAVNASFLYQSSINSMCLRPDDHMQAKACPHGIPVN